MEKKEQLLIIQPQNELKFRGPFNQAITSHMRLTNPTDKTILFKIKTTAPKKYCVRPNSGFLAPAASVEVSICLQPFTFDPNEKNKHKFMVQSLVVPEEYDSYEQLWKEVTPEQLMDSKLRCVFEMPVDKTAKPTKPEVARSTNDASGEFIASESASLPVSAEISSFISGDSNNPELVRAAVEVRQLRTDESKLRQENFQLQEEIQRLRLNANSRKEEVDPFTPKRSQLQQQQPMPVMYVVAAIVMVVVGILFGKLIL